MNEEGETFRAPFCSKIKR